MLSGLRSSDPALAPKALRLGLALATVVVMPRLGLRVDMVHLGLRAVTLFEASHRGHEATILENEVRGRNRRIGMKDTKLGLRAGTLSEASHRGREATILENEVRSRNRQIRMMPRLGIIVVTAIDVPRPGRPHRGQEAKISTELDTRREAVNVTEPGDGNSVYTLR